MELSNKNLGVKRYQFANNFQNRENLQMQCETKIEQLKESVDQLKRNIDELKVTIVQQNSVIMEALAAQKVLTENLLLKEKQKISLHKYFPLQTIDSLKEMNNNIKDANRAAYIQCIASLLKGQVNKSLTEIFSLDLILASNLNGIHGKLSLKEYKKFYDVLIDAVRDLGEEDSENAIRNALKLIKKRHFQAVCIQKKRNNMQ